jgi:ParB-like chromosome segregation protein Spo0J
MAKKMQINTGNLNFDITGNGNPTTGYTEGQIVEIPNDKIFENNNQHFIIHEDTIDELAERIARDGQLSPCIVVPLPDGIYELIDGRHRRRAV